MSKELEALEHIKEHCEHYYDALLGKMEEYKIVENALNELEDAKHNYKALEEMHNNSVAYATKIQKELNELKKRNEPMKPNYSGKFPVCPSCRTLLHSIWQKRCSNCGQAIDWSDEK